MRAIPGHHTTITGLTFTPDGCCLAIADRAGNCSLWQLAEAFRLDRLTLPGRIEQLACSPNGQALAFALDREGSAAACTVEWWELWPPERHDRWPAHAYATRAVAFLQSGNHLATGGDKGEVRLWHPPDGLQRTLVVGPGPVEALAPVPGSDDLAILCRGARVVPIWNLVTGKPQAAIPLPSGGRDALAVSPDGQWLAGSLGREIALAYLHDSRLPTTWTAHDDSIADLAFTPDGRRLLSAGHDGLVRIWDIPSATNATASTGNSPTSPPSPSRPTG